jgi:dTDP-4-dehydrorhamnose 3,5-epimerase
MLTVVDLAFDGVRLITPRSWDDHRGSFTEMYNARDWSQVTNQALFVQDNVSVSSAQHTVRGLHYQLPPAAQGKLVRVLKGAIEDVVVDVRTASSTFGHILRVRLDDTSPTSLWIPEGFAHGFLTLQPDTHVFYKVTAFYDPAAERTMQALDPQFKLDWPQVIHRSAKDESAPLLTTFTNNDLF